MSRDFSSISPSASKLLMARAHSGLPYAREAAEIIFGAEAVAQAAYVPSQAAAIRRKHFERRARSIDEALDVTGETRVLELAAGFSLRGLARAARPDVHYVDTDLPNVVELKTQLLERLAPPPLAGIYRIAALDALDRDAFMHTVESIPPGPIAIVQEGLLMYLEPEEKARLAATIRTVLRARGGSWITADVYVRGEALPRDESVQQFLAEHRVDELKFEDWDEAEAFFATQGFYIERSDDKSPIRQTWVLKPGK